MAQTAPEAARCRVFDDARDGDGPGYQGIGGGADLALLQFSSGLSGLSLCRARQLLGPGRRRGGDAETGSRVTAPSTRHGQLAAVASRHGPGGAPGRSHHALRQLVADAAGRVHPLAVALAEVLRAGGSDLWRHPELRVAHIVRRVRPAMLEGLDFSGWRALIVGAERVDPLAISELISQLSPAGFSAQAVSPAYGMAETALAVTAAPLTERFRTIRVDTTRLYPVRRSGSAAQPIRRRASSWSAAAARCAESASPSSEPTDRRCPRACWGRSR